MLNSLHDTITVCSNDSIVEILQNDEGFFKSCVPMDDFQWSIVISMIYVGGLCGNFIPDILKNYFSQSVIVWFGNIPGLIGIVIMSLFSSVWTFVIGRFLMGLTAGITWNIVPIYFSHIAPANLRGGFGVTLMLSHYISTLTAQFLGIFLGFHPGWRILIGLSALIAFVQLISIPFVVISPRWLLSQGKTEKARVHLSKLRNHDPTAWETEFENIGAEIKRSEASRHEFSLMKRLYANPKVIKNCVLMTFLFTMRSFAGSNIVAQYSTDIFQDVGIFIPAIATALTGICNLVAVIIALFIVDKLGRRKLMIAGSIGQTFSFGLLALSYILTSRLPWISWFALVGVLGFIFSFAMAMGPIVPMIQTELFPADLQSFGVTLSTFVDWGSAALITFLYPSMATLLKDYVFVPFFLINVINLVGVAIFLPETKSRTLEELQHSYS